MALWLVSCVLFCRDVNYECSALKMWRVTSILLNVGLRGSTLACKFMLVFVLARFLEPSELGLYGLFVVTVAYSMYPLGFEFYTYSSRQMVKAQRSERYGVLKNQLALHGVLYFFVYPLLYLVFYLNLLPPEYAIYFFALVALEHLNQESMRLLIAMQHQLVATTALFFRQGVWAIVAVAIFYFFPHMRNLETVLICWLLGALLALLVAGTKVFLITVTPDRKKAKTDWLWIKNGLKVALPLFAASLSINFISTADRYWFEHLNGLDVLGAYVFYASIAASLITFMDAGIFSFMYPKLLVSHAEKDYIAFVKNFKSMAWQVAIVGSVFMLGVVFLSDKIFLLMHRDIYLEFSSIFYFLITAMFVQSLSYIPHFALYALDLDKGLVISGVLSVPIFIFLVLVFGEFTKLYAVPLALLGVSCIVLLYKLNRFSREFKIVKVGI